MKKEITDLTKEELINEIKLRDQLIKTYVRHNEIMERLLGMGNAIQK